MITGYHRGHIIVFVNNEWYYKDTNVLVSTQPERACGYCKKKNTPEGHDPCLGTLPNIMNACCGHGQDDEAYLQFKDGSCVRGADALKLVERKEQ